MKFKKPSFKLDQDLRLVGQCSKSPFRIPFLIFLFGLSNIRSFSSSPIKRRKQKTSLFVRLDAEHVVDVQPQLQQPTSLVVVEVGGGLRVGQQSRGNGQRAPVGELHWKCAARFRVLLGLAPTGTSASGCGAVEADWGSIQRNSKFVRLRDSRGDSVQRRGRVELGRDER